MINKSSNCAHRSRSGLWVLPASFLAIIVWLGPASLSAALTPVVLNSSNLPVNRQGPGSRSSPNVGLLRSLMLIKSAAERLDFASCSRLVRTALLGAGDLAPWLATTGLECAAEGVQRSVVQPEVLRELVVAVDAKPQWLLFSTPRDQLRRSLIRAGLNLIESEIKRDRKRAWRDYELVAKFEDDMGVSEEAALNRLAGDILFVDQNLDGAKSFFLRSQQIQPSQAVRERLRAFRLNPSEMDSAKLSLEGSGDKNNEASIETAANVDLELSGDEQELLTRISTALKTGDLLSAAEDGRSLANRFSGSTRKKWVTDRLLEAYLSIRAKPAKPFAEIRQRFFRVMIDFDSETLYRWAKANASQGYYDDAYQLAEKSIGGWKSMAKSTPVIFLAARSALSSGQSKAAEKWFNILVERHAGTTESRESLFYLGLLELQAKTYARAAFHFERLLAMPNADAFELPTRYWLWRTLQLQSSNKAAEQSAILQRKFPFSYYGLRARLEANGNKLEFVWQSQKVSAKLWLNSNQKAGLRRYEILAKAGWWDEAQAELTALPTPLTSEGKALMALLFAEAMNFNRATALINQVWDREPNLRNPPFLRAVFPKEFAGTIKKVAADYRLDPLLIASLIKQESAFGLRAISSSGALGLMQMIPPTAQEVAGQLAIKNLRIPEDLFRPETNIKMGAFYLAQMLDRYKNVVPLALAAYNAGPSRLDKWLEARVALESKKDSVTIAASSSPLDELWIEELPWSETRLYVKAILRNWLIYSALDFGPQKLSEPLWRNMVKERLDTF